MRRGRNGEPQFRASVDNWTALKDTLGNYDRVGFKALYYNGKS